MLKSKGQHHSTKERLQKQIGALLKRWHDAHTKYQGNEYPLLLSREIREMRLMLCHCLLDMVQTEPLHYGTSSLNLMWEKLFYPHFVMIKRLKKTKKAENLQAVLVEYRNVLGLAATALRRAMGIIYSHQNCNHEHLMPFVMPFIDIISINAHQKSEMEVSNRLEYQDWSVDALFLCLMHLGDVYRYHLDLKESHCKLWAQRCYNLANMLKPSDGLPYNAMANLDTSTYYGLPAVWNYLQALTVDRAFPSAQANLEVLLQRCSHLLRMLLSSKRKMDRGTNSRMKKIMAVKHFVHRFLAVVHRCVLPNSAHAKMDVRDVCRDVSHRFVGLLQDVRCGMDYSEEPSAGDGGFAEVGLDRVPSRGTDRGSPTRLTSTALHLVVLTVCVTWNFTSRKLHQHRQQTQSEDANENENKEDDQEVQFQNCRTRDCLADLSLTFGISLIQHILSLFHELCLKEKARTPVVLAATASSSQTKSHPLSSPSHEATPQTSESNHHFENLRRKKWSGVEEDSSDLSEGGKDALSLDSDADSETNSSSWRTTTKMGAYTSASHDSEEDEQKIRSHYGIPMEDPNAREEDFSLSDSDEDVEDVDLLEEDDRNQSTIPLAMPSSTSSIGATGGTTSAFIRLPRAGTALKVISEETGHMSVGEEEVIHVEELHSNEASGEIRSSRNEKLAEHVDWATITSSDEMEVPMEMSKKIKKIPRIHKKCRLSISELSTAELLLRAQLLHSLEALVALVKVLCDWYEVAFSGPSVPESPMLPWFWVALKGLLNLISPLLALPARLPENCVSRVKTRLSWNNDSNSWHQRTPLTEDRLLFGTHFLQRAHEHLDIHDRPEGPLEETLLRAECLFRFGLRHSTELQFQTDQQETTCCLFTESMDLEEQISTNDQSQLSLLPDNLLPRSAAASSSRRRSHRTRKDRVHDEDETEELPDARNQKVSSVDEVTGENQQESEESHKLEMMRRMATLRLQSEVTHLERHRKQQSRGRRGGGPGSGSSAGNGRPHTNNSNCRRPRMSPGTGRSSRDSGSTDTEVSRHSSSTSVGIRSRGGRGYQQSSILQHPRPDEENTEDYNEEEEEDDMDEMVESLNVEEERLQVEELAPVLLVPDTDCFVEHLGLVKRLLNMHHFVIIVARVVVNHLDLLKKDNQQARVAIRFLESHTKRGHRFMRFQQADEQVDADVIQKYVPLELQRLGAGKSSSAVTSSSCSRFSWRWQQLLACAAYFHKQHLDRSHSSTETSSTAENAGVVCILTDRQIGDSFTSETQQTGDNETTIVPSGFLQAAESLYVGIHNLHVFVRNKADLMK